MPYTFIGIIPEKNKLAKELLEEIEKYNSVLIFYVSPHNLTTTLDLLSKSLGNRECAIVREISKMYEEVTFSTLADGYNGVLKGEFVVVVQKPQKRENALNEKSVEEHLLHYIHLGDDKNTAIKKVCKDRNLKKNDVYMVAINLKEK